jgi:hypothetical protein
MTKVLNRTMLLAIALTAGIALADGKGLTVLSGLLKTVTEFVKSDLAPGIGIIAGITAIVLALRRMFMPAATAGIISGMAFGFEAVVKMLQALVGRGA